jgi:Ca2+-transporting ATPase
VASEDEESVLNAVQLLWVNLIMDTFAALALATDPPMPSILDRKPDRKSAPLITLRMTKMIVGQAICQLVITFVLNFAGRRLLGYDGVENGDIRLQTLVFNTFVWLQIFNELNNRRLDNKLNIFEGITHNYFFIIINLIMIGGQVLIIFVGGQAFRITRLNGWEWGMSIGLGAISLPFGAAIRLLPDSWVSACLPPFMRRWWEPKPEGYTPPPSDEQTKALEEGKVSSDNDDKVGSVEFGKPLRVLSAVRGERARKHIHSGFREYMHVKKTHIKDKAHRGHANGSKKDVVVA